MERMNCEWWKIDTNNILRRMLVVPSSMPRWVRLELSCIAQMANAQRRGVDRTLLRKNHAGVRVPGLTVQKLDQKPGMCRAWSDWTIGVLAYLLFLAVLGLIGYGFFKL